MSRLNGSFIAIESPLEAYATTHIKHLRSRLEEAGFETVYFAFPQSGKPSSYFAERYAQGKYGLTTDVVPYAGSLFFALDHFEAGAAIRKAIENGKVVIAHKYLGANMVEQGAKLPHPAERKGYFLWLDNLESRVLSTPRPDKTFVLNLPEGHIKLKTSEDEGYAVTPSMQATLYTELCDLYPKDFVRLDLERNGKLLNENVVRDILWGLVEPLLPVKEKPVPIKEVESVFIPLDNSVLPTYALTLTVSQLLLGQIIGYLPNVPYKTTMFTLKDSTDLNYLKPDYFTKLVKTNYSDALASLHKNYLLIQKGLKKYKEANPDIHEIPAELVRAILPVATLSKLALQVTASQLEILLIQLLSNELPEAWELGQKLLKISRQHNSAIDIKASVIADNATRQRKLRKLAKDLTPNHALADSHTAELISLFPRNELDLLPHMIYEQSDMMYSSIDQNVSVWSFDKKLTAIETYFSQLDIIPSGGTILKDVNYIWDMQTNFHTLSHIQQVSGAKIVRQHLTPRFGYGIPSVIEEANLTEIYQDSFDRSMQLYSDLQQAGYELEAQLVTLGGHKQRWTLSCDGEQLLHTLRTSADSTINELLLASLQERHPAIGTFLLHASS